MNDPLKDTSKKRPGRTHRIGFWTVSGIIVLTSLLLVVGLSFTARGITAPDWLTEQVVRRVNATLPDGRITMGRLRAQLGTGGVPRVTMGDLGIFDARGAEIARLNDVDVRMSLAALLRGKLKAERFQLSGAQMTLRRLADGRFDISLGSGSAATGTLPVVLDLLDAAFLTPPLEQVDFLGADDLNITLEDTRSGRFWRITQGSLQVRRGDSGLDISVAFDVFNGTEELAETVIGIRTDANSSMASIGTSFKNAASADIALQSPVLSFLGVLDAPISGAVRVDFDDVGTLSTLAGTLEIGTGALLPGTDIAPVRFSSAKTYFEFDPEKQRLDFSQVSVVSESVNVTAQGQAYLRDLQGGWPSTLLGQFSLSDLNIHPQGVFEEAISFSQGAADFRIRLSPFEVEIGQFVLIEEDEKLVVDGRIAAKADGWEIAGDLKLNRVDQERLLSIWPVAFSPNTRNWLRNQLRVGVFEEIKAAVRFQPGRAPRRLIEWNFRDLALRYINAQPEIEKASGYATIDGDGFTVVVEDGTIVAPSGGAVTLSGTTIKIPDVTLKPAPISIRINGSAGAEAVLSLLDERPFSVLRNANFGPDVADGLVNFQAAIDFTLKRNIAVNDVTYAATATLAGITSEKLVPGRVLSADKLDLTADNDVIEITGPLRLGEVSTEMLWHKKLGPGNTGGGTVTGTVELSQDFIHEFGIGLPDGAVQGTGLGQFELNLPAQEVPNFTLISDLNRVQLNIAQIGWLKPKNATGKLSVAGTLGARPEINLLEIDTTGLIASGGQVTMAQNGSMQAATFSRVRVGDWLDAPVTLRGRGAGVVPSVQISGGEIDIRKTALGGADSKTNGAGGPISLNLDRVIVSEGISLTDFAGEFDSAGGLNGTFTARMNGKAPISGRLVPDANGTAVRIQSQNAGAVLRDAGVVEYANNGSLDLTLRPQPQNGVYNGQMQIRSTNVLNAPGLTDLLSAISIVGLLEQLGGRGILFEQVDATFRLTPKSVELIRSSAVGPSLGVSLDGVYDLTTSTMDMQGVVSPVYFLNSIGQIFSRRGEGLFGFNFRLRGTSREPKVSVNPLSILTPGIFRDIFRAPPPKPAQ